MQDSGRTIVNGNHFERCLTLASSCRRRCNKLPTIVHYEVPGSTRKKERGECKGGRENEGKTKKRVEFRPCCHSVCIVAANILRLAGTWHEARGTRHERKPRGRR